MISTTPAGVGAKMPAPGNGFCCGSGSGGGGGVKIGGGTVAGALRMTGAGFLLQSWPTQAAMLFRLSWATPSAWRIGSMALRAPFSAATSTRLSNERFVTGATPDVKSHAIGPMNNTATMPTRVKTTALNVSIDSPWLGNNLRWLIPSILSQKPLLCQGPKIGLIWGLIDIAFGLFVEHAGVDASFFKERFVGAFLGDAPVLKNYDFVGISNRRKPM